MGLTIKDMRKLRADVRRLHLHVGDRAPAQPRDGYGEWGSMGPEDMRKTRRVIRFREYMSYQECDELCDELMRRNTHELLCNENHLHKVRQNILREAVDVAYIAIGNLVTFGCKVQHPHFWSYGDNERDATLEAITKLVRLSTNMSRSMWVWGAGDTLSEYASNLVGVCEKLCVFNGKPLFLEAWDEVHAANMRKSKERDKTGRPIKPEGWVAPDMSGILAAAYQ